MDNIRRVGTAVEGAVSSVVQQPVAKPADTGLMVAGSCTISQARFVDRKLYGVPRAEGANHDGGQPHVECWIGRSADGRSVCMMGTLMVDTGATVSIVSRKWAEAHNIAIKPADDVRVTSFTGQQAKIVGKVNFTTQIGALELQLG